MLGVVRRALVIENINRASLKTESLREAVDDFGQVLKRVLEVLAVGSIREAKAGEIRCDHMEVIGEALIPTP